MQEEKQILTADEVRKRAPGYRGKVENFDPTLVGTKRRPPTMNKPKENRVGPSSRAVQPPRFLEANKNPTPLRNESIIAESVFGVDVSVTPIHQLQSFKANYSKIPALAKEIFTHYNIDNKTIDRHLVKEEMVYYSTALLWMKLIDVKDKLKRVALTKEERKIQQSVKDSIFNVPQPLYVYLSQIGTVTDKMGKETEIDIPSLPISVAQGYGGYHAVEINVNTHNMFEEIPCLGLAADAVMAAASMDENPVQPMRLAIPAGSVQTANLLGYATMIGARRGEIRQRLNGIGIGPNAFPELVANSRFNLKYIQMLSDIIGQQETYRVEKVAIPNLTMSGGPSQVIITRPMLGEDDDMSWTTTTVQPTSAACESIAQMGASYVFGFQLYKEPGPGGNLTQQARRWSCITSVDAAQEPWVIPNEWNANRNVRRDLPEGIGTERFRGTGKRQDITTEDVVRRMIKQSR